MSLNLASIVENSCRYFPDATALIHDAERLSYLELRRHVVAFAAHLKRIGVGRGDKVALLSPNRMSFTVGYFGILYAGAAVVKPGQGAKFTQTEVDDYTSKALSADELQTATGGQWYNPGTWDWWVWGVIAAVVIVVIIGGLWAGDVF